MDKPVRKYQKQKDYQRHKLFRKMKRRRKAAIEQAKDAPMKPLRRKFKIPKFEDGKDDKPNVFQLPDGTFVNSHNEPLDVLDYAGVEDPTKWTYVDKKGNRYTPKAARTLTEGEQFTQRQIENEQNTRPFEFTPYIEGANEGAAAASLMMGFPFNVVGSAYYTAKASRDAYNRNYLGAVLNGLGAVTPAGSGILQSVKRLLPKEKTLITAENAANITPEVTHFYHGSPVRFDTFSADFIGSGEGGSKVMQGINLWPKEKIANAPKFANIKSSDAPLHLGVSSTPLGGELNPTVYDVSGRGLKLYTTSPRNVKGLSQSDLVSQGYDGIQTPNQVTVFPKSIGKLSIDKQSTIEEFILAHPEVERWTPWTTDNQKMQNIIDMSRMSEWTSAQWTAAQDAAIAKGDMAEAQRLRDLHFKVSAPDTKIVDENGEPLRLYHGTKSKFNAFNESLYGSTDGGMYGTGVYTTPYKDYAENYGDVVMNLYANISNPVDARNLSIDDLMLGKLEEGNNIFRWTDIGGKRDGVLGKNHYLSTKYPYEVVSHKPSKVKSADAVTYDNNGVRIPLGERDNFNINDIRYGLLAPLAGGTALLGYNSLGQPIDTYKHGKDSGIHINPKNRGKFNALKKRTGKTTEQLTHSKNPLTRKRAIFAQNAKKWKH